MIEKFYELLTKVGITKGQDKVLHAIGGFILTSVLALVLGGSVAFIFALALSISKEVYDKYNDGTVDFFDMFFTLFAGVVSIMLWLGLFHIEPLYEIKVSKYVFFVSVAVFGSGVWYLFKKG